MEQHSQGATQATLDVNEETMRFRFRFYRVVIVLLLVPVYLLTSCGGPPPATPGVLSTDTPEPTATSLPEPSTTPAEPSTPEPTVDPNAVVRGGKVVIGIPREPDVLSPIMADEDFERILSLFMVEGLVQIDAQGNPVPVLAEELPAISEDGLILTYPLKKGINFANGDPFSCADVQFTWKAVMSYLSPVSKAGYELIRTVDCPDEYTAVVGLTSGYSQYYHLFSFILPKGAGSPDTVNKWDYHTAPVGTGPWKVLEWQVGDHILLVRNEYFRDPDKPYLDSIELKFMKYRENSFDLLSKGEVDISWGLDESSLAFLENLAAEGISYSEAQSGANEILVFNLADPSLDAPPDAAANPNPILGDVRVRQALRFAIDKEAIVNQLYAGRVHTSSSVLPSGPFACALPPSQYSLDEAKALLESAGWKVGADGIREKDGARLSLRFTTENENEPRLQIQQAIVEMVKAVGIELVIENVPSKDFNASWKAGSPRKHGRFDILLLSSEPGITPAITLKRDFHSNRIPTAYNQGNGNNLSRYYNPDVDAWIDQAGSSTSSVQQQELYCQIAGQIDADVPVIPLFEHLVISAYRADLQNFTISPGPSSFTLGSENWWLRP